MILTSLLLLAGVLDAPVSLTTSDGSGLKLVSLDADAVCSGPVCFTEVRLAFDNPTDRVIEGQFQIALPPGASVSRFAMKLDERWQEAEVVEKQAARRAYEDFLHRRQDPALLEQAAGNQFQARVFPIPARGRKELTVSYGHTLSTSKAAWTLPLAGLPQVEALKVRVRDGDGRALFDLEKKRFVPNADVNVAVAGANVVRAEDVVVVRAAVPFKDAAADAFENVVVLVDTSASRALQLDKDILLLKDVVKQGTGDVVVVTFDQTQQEVYRGPMSGFDAKTLSARRALGATDLGAALAFAGELVAKDKKFSRVVVVSDGVGTADLGVPVSEAVASMKAKGVRRVDAVVRGGVRDVASLGVVVKGGAEEGVVVDGDAPAKDIVGRLSKKAKSGVVVDVKGAAWFWPKVLDGVQPGDQRVIVAEVKAGAPVVVSFGGSDVDVGPAASAPAPLLRRAWAEARIARTQAALENAKSDGEKKELKEQIVALSTRHRVLSSETALLILETEADYARYGIDRKALADVLVVDDRGLGLVQRSDIVARAAAPTPPKTSATKAKKGAAPGRDDRADRAEKASAGPPADEGAIDGEHIDGDIAEEAKEAPTSDAASTVNAAAPTLNAPPPAAAPRPTSMPPPPPATSMAQAERRRSIADDVSEPAETFVNPWTGPFDDGMKLLQKGDRLGALKKARAWREEEPGDVLALLLLAEALQDDDVDEAARALGAIIDLFPARTDLRRAVGARLDALNARAQKAKKPVSTTATRLSIDTWKKSVEQRPDHPQSHRGLAYALLRAGRFAEAFAAAEHAVRQTYRADSFRGVDQILREDVGLVAAAWKKAGTAPQDLDARVSKVGGVMPSGASLRFVLWWETDANDVDFHIRDAKKNHAYYSQPALGSGGNLYADVTTGYGPECFTIPGTPTAYPYALSAHYYSRGPMGFGMGDLVVVEHDGKGGLRFDDRPFVIMVDGAFVDLGKVAGPL